MMYARLAAGKIISYDEGASELDKPMILHYPSEVISQSDSLKGLCDEFVCNERLVCKSRLAETCKMLLSEGKEIFGAIWTNKGLIYVAKTKGVSPEGEVEWELI